MLTLLENMPRLRTSSSSCWHLTASSVICKARCKRLKRHSLVFWTVWNWFGPSVDGSTWMKTALSTFWRQSQTKFAPKYAWRSISSASSRSVPSLTLFQKLSRLFRSLIIGKSSMTRQSLRLNSRTSRDGSSLVPKPSLRNPFTWSQSSKTLFGPVEWPRSSKPSWMQIWSKSLAVPIKLMRLRTRWRRMSSHCNTSHKTYTKSLIRKNGRFSLTNSVQTSTWLKKKLSSSSTTPSRTSLALLKAHLTSSLDSNPLTPEQKSRQPWSANIKTCLRGTTKSWTKSRSFM